MFTDQAATLRRVMRPRPVQVIAVTSGKGGVGKTNVSVNLACALSKRGRAVMLMDADLGLANVDVILGLANRYNLLHVVMGRCTLDEIIVEGPDRVMIVPAASGIKKMAELDASEHATLIRAFSELDVDVDTLIVDTASGISESVMTFSQAATDVLVVVCDEPASMADAYGLIKVLNRDRGIEHFHVVANMVGSVGQGTELFNKLLRVSNRFLDVTLDYAGAIPSDEFVRRAVQHQTPLVNAFPRCRAATAIEKLAARADDWPLPPSAGHMSFFFERLVSGMASSFTSTPGGAASSHT